MQHASRLLASALIALLGWLGAASTVIAQGYPQTLPGGTVYGRLEISPGPGEAIPFSTLSARLSGIGATILRPTDKAYGALCDGTTDDTAALVKLGTAASAAGIVDIEFPPNRNCRVWPTADSMVANRVLLNLTSVSNSRINFNGTLVTASFGGIPLTGSTDTTTTIQTGSTAGLGLQTNMNIVGAGIPDAAYIVTINPTSLVISAATTATASGVAITVFPVSNTVINFNGGFNNEVNGYRVKSNYGKHAFTGFTHIYATNGAKDIRLNGGFADGGSVGVAAGRFPGSATPRVSKIHSTLEFFNVYYPGNFADDGDVVTGQFISHNAGRPFVTYGTIGTDVYVHAIDATSQMVMGNFIADNDYPLTQARIFFSDRGSVVTNGVPLEIQSHPVNGSTAGRGANDIDLTLDMDETSRSCDRLLVTQSSDGSGSVGPYPAAWNIRINGSVVGNCATSFMELGQATDGFGTGMDVNITLSNLVAKDMTAPLKIGTNANVHISMRDVDVPQSALSADSVTFADRAFTGSNVNFSNLVNAAGYVTGGIFPGKDNAWALGASSLRWSSISATTGNIGTPTFSALTGIVQAKGSSAATAITDSSTTGQVLRVTGASTYGWGALDLANSSATAGALGVARGGTGLSSGTSGGILGFTATGTLASSGLLTANALVLGGGAGATPTVLGSLGTTTTLLHGNASGAPTFGAVALGTDVSGTLPAANGGTGVSNSANLTVSSATSVGRGQYQGTATNDDATAGNIGEYVSNSATAVSLSSGTTGNITSISLTAGDWDVSGIIRVFPANTTVLANSVGSVSLTSATTDTTEGRVFNTPGFTGNGTALLSGAVPAVRISLASTTTVYLTLNAAFSVSTCTGYGAIHARRVR